MLIAIMHGMLFKFAEVNEKEQQPRKYAGVTHFENTWKEDDNNSVLLMLFGGSIAENLLKKRKGNMTDEEYERIRRNITGQDEEGEEADAEKIVKLIHHIVTGKWDNTPLIHHSAGNVGYIDYRWPDKEWNLFIKARSEVECKLNNNWHIVDAVAQALLEKKVLSYNEVLKIVASLKVD